MLPTAELSATLTDLDAHFSGALASGAPPKQLNYYCKLALMEMCGWIEQAVDQIVYDSAARSTINDMGMVKDKVKKTSQFEYQSNVRPLIILVTGLRNCERIELSLSNKPTSLFEPLKSRLLYLKPKRNTHAHTHLVSAQTAFDAPSIVHSWLPDLVGGLTELEDELKAFGY